MNRQLSFSDAEFSRKKRVTRRERFLGDMEKRIPWQRLLAVLEPVYYAGKRGRPPIGLERMLRMYLLQLWYHLSDEALEDEIYESQTMRAFVGIDLGRERVPDATTLLKFRHLIERSDKAQALLEAVNAHMREQGLMLSGGTIVDASIIAAPSSTKNKDKQRDPDMHQTRKGNQWYFGMKAHIGVDVATGLVHTVTGTPANVADVAEAPNLVRDDDRWVLGDAGYLGLEKRLEEKASDKSTRKRTLLIAEKRGRIKKMPEGELKDACIAHERKKASLRSSVEHPFHVIKNLFRFKKVKYRGMKKNTSHIKMLFALANIVLSRRIQPSCA